MYQRVTLPSTRVVEKCGGKKSFPRFTEGHAHRVVHSAGHYGVHFRAVGSHTVDVGGSIVDDLATRSLVLLTFKGSFALVNPTVRAEVWTMQVICAIVGRLAVKPLYALVGHAIAISVCQFPDDGHGATVKGPIVPKSSFRKHHFVCKYSRLFKLAVSVGVFKPYDAVRRVFNLFRYSSVGSGGVGNV
jgi:hypothetical protein